LDGLNHLPADTLIFDQSFISRFPQHEYIAGMITAMVAMGRALGLYVAAEGVETQEQLDFLLPLCDEIQGGAVSTALSAEDMTVLLQKGKIEPLTAVR
jgi:EAL domain-containing protein (putative c-di-GMP-specific phosphodiesterase class I)